MGKLIILGLDGMPFSLMKKFIEDGTMPASSKIIGDGNLMQMNASIPDVSSVSWSSFITGKSPSEHGILGFVEIDPSNYRIKFPNFLDNNCKTFWETLSEKGKSCCVINVPGTYPAKPLNGILISGFPAVNIEKAVYPSSLTYTIKNFKYKLDVEFPGSKDDLDFFFSDLLDTMKIRMNVFKNLFHKNNFDLFFPCITEIDRFHHFFFDALSNDDEKSKRLIQFYKILDEHISEIYSWADKNDKFIMISDHGFTKIKQEFYINSWLKQNNFLEDVSFEGTYLKGITNKTKAFALDPCRIFIHQKEKFRDGSAISKNEYDNLREKIIEELDKLKFQGEKVIKKCFKKEEIYPEGNSFKNAADIICLPADGFDIKAALNKNLLFGKSIFTGMHTQHDALFFINDKDFYLDHKLNISEAYNLLEI